MLIQNSTTIKKYDENDVLLNTEETISTVNFKRSNEEGNFIKIYTDNMDMLSNLPPCCLHLLFELCKHMSYADVKDKHGGQLIRINKSIREDIQQAVGIKKRAFFKHLKILKDNGIIKDCGSGDYQINPRLIGKGLFEYNPKLKFGGIKDIRETFDTDKLASTEIEYNIPLIKELLGTELEALKEEYAKVKNKKTARLIAIDIKAYESEINKLNDTEYTKNIRYEEIENLKNNMKELHDDIVESGETSEFGDEL